MPKIYHIYAKIAIWSLIFSLFSSDSVGARIPDDPNYQKAIWEQINAPMAWDLTVGSRLVTIATIDTGADNWHEDLEKNIWTNHREIPDNGRDDDKNGYVDDRHGWNFIENNNDTRTSVFDSGVDREVVNHGTIIAGLAGAIGDNGLGGAGLNWQVKIMPLRAVDGDGRGPALDVIRAVDYAADNGADVISLSFVTEFKDDAVTDALRRAYERGIVIVAAAGNERAGGNGDLDRRPLYPICADAGETENWIVGVSSVNSDDRLSRFADYGSCVDILAPGENIFSAQRYAPAYGYPDAFGGGWNGTSFSVPIVAGAAALMKSVRPDWGAKQIIQNLLRTAVNVDEKNFGLAGRLGAGRLNAGLAVAQAWVGKPAAADTADIYSFKNNEFFSFNLKNKKWGLVGRVPEAGIISLTAVDVNNDKQVETAMLIKRGNYYYVRTMVGGFLLDEFSVAGAVAGKMPAVEMSIFDDGEENYFYAVTLRDIIKKRTVLRKYGTNGFLVEELKLDWLADSCRAGWKDGIVCIKKEKGAYKLLELNWQGDILHSINLGKGDSIDGLAVGFGVKGPAAAAVVRRGRQNYLLLVDLANKKVVTKSLGILAGQKWQLLFGRFGRQPAVLVYNAKGGKFSAYDVSGRVVTKVNILAL